MEIISKVGLNHKYISIHCIALLRYFQYLYVWKDFKRNIKSNEQQGPLLNEEDTDEELEEKYANIDVNFDESETEEEEYVPRSGQFRSKNCLQIDEVLEEDLQDEFDRSLPEYENIPISRGKSFIQDDLFLAEPGTTITKMFALHLIRNNNGDNLFRY